jgi:hypothetical protein
MRDGDGRTEYVRRDSISATVTSGRVVLDYSTTSESRLIVDSPTWRGGSPGNRLIMEGTQEWDLGAGLPVRGKVSLRDEFGGDGGTVEFQLMG